MVKLVAGDEVGERENRHRVAVGDAAAQPSFFVQRTKQSEAGLAHIRILLDQIRELALAEARAANESSCSKPESGVSSPRANPQSAISENSLGIGDVAEHFFYTPLVRRVPEISVALAAARENVAVCLSCAVSASRMSSPGTSKRIAPRRARNRPARA